MVILGMGGSGLAGDVCRTLLKDSQLFVETVKGDRLPGWVGRETLVFAVSHSGETDETLYTVKRAIESKAQVIAVSRGGELGALGQELALPFVEVPPGFRASIAVAYLIIPLLVICERLGLTPPLGEAIPETVGLLRARCEQYGRESPSSANLAKQLAGWLLKKLPVVYGTEGLAAMAAYRWKCQFNETAKVPAYWNVFTELNHNEVVGQERGLEIAPNLAMLVLRDEEEHPRVRWQSDNAFALLQRHVDALYEFRGRGSSVVSRLFDLICLGDFSSTQLAPLQGVDPMPVEMINRLKRASRK